MISQFPQLSKADIVEIQKLQRKKFRLATQSFFIEGARFCQEALHSGWSIQKIICTPQFSDSENASRIFEDEARKGIAVFSTSERDFKKIANTEHAQGIGMVMAFPVKKILPENLLSKKVATLVAMEELNDPGNLGTIIRTAEWLGIDGLILGKNAVSWHNSKVLRASMGAVFHLPIIEVDDFHHFLKDAESAGFIIYAADQNGTTTLQQLKTGTKSLLLFGDEAHGLSDECRQAAREIICIEGKGKVESLNVASAAAILMAKFCQTQKA
ncbi:MAG: RNA methyltransferase [Deferribacteres bacterium]|nr:RNA methyltransferase [candidate division KSB1 bacterium]MCB9503015.1 RNA methyltransferase [Deferribacteres bacterium]